MVMVIVIVIVIMCCLFIVLYVHGPWRGPRNGSRNYFLVNDMFSIFLKLKLMIIEVILLFIIKCFLIIR